MTAVTAWSRGKRGSTWKPWSRRAVRISPWLGWLSGYAAHDAVVVESMSSTIRLQEPRRVDFKLALAATRAPI
jgi:hypothetical protein